ncbi:MAG: type II secretion system GspH family protein [Oscillospiraceae bacterium]|nr:type II secretion system GspH family protein [Oscillospiraceae bacterium]
MKRLKGFTLLELIVVIAIIGILAAFLVPSFLGYVRNARASRLNANARSVYSAAQLAIVDMNVAQVEVLPNCVYIGSSDGIAYPNRSGDEFTLLTYLGEDFEGNFLFVTNSEGSGCLYALWSEQPIAVSSSAQLTVEDVKNSVNTSTPKGCHPLKASS